jgi:phosphoribosylformylglycinamidine synthase
MPQQVLTLPGAAALSPFRVEKLLASLPRELAQAIALEARFVHFVAVSAALTEAERQTLEKLLTTARSPRGSPRAS